MKRQAAKRAALRKQARKAGLRYTKITPEYQRIKFVRYADDFIIGYRGPKEVAQKLKSEVSFFLKSTLHLDVNEEKTHLTDTFSGKANFLGFTIHNVADKPFWKAGELQQLKNNRSRVLNRINEMNKRLEKLTREKVLENLRTQRMSKGANKSSEDLASAIDNLLPQNSRIELTRQTYRELVNNLMRIS